ncbi:MAG: hypothetical protein D6737_11125 [Chloroflexi bacterium]|nr:MAG: hypothetical protein D6737_11125 [Chloroflexota bacterium]
MQADIQHESPQQTTSRKINWRSYVLGIIPLMLMIVVLLLIARWVFADPNDDIYPDVLFIEPGFPPKVGYEGLFSNLGVVFLLVGATVTLVAAYVHGALYKGNRWLTGYLAAIGIAGLILGLDDMLSFHEYIAENDLDFIGQTAAKLLLASMWVVIAVVFFRQLRREIVFLLLFAFLFLFSQVYDEMAGDGITLAGQNFRVERTETQVFIEESAEFLASMTFLIFTTRLSTTTLKAAEEDRRKSNVAP